MGLLTIGAFARAARLSPKALRLYDDLGLLSPARVDPASGYRLYDPAQLERARLVAWLRRLGMPLARIRAVCDLPAAKAAEEVRAYWADVEAGTAARRDLAAFLVDHLARKETHVTAQLRLDHAARTDTGLVRESNQDCARAGDGLLAVADGFGPGGAAASAAAVHALTGLDTASGDLLNVLDEAVEQAARAVREAAASGGTTLTALLWTGSRFALVHVGDSRAYLLREGSFFQITHDHTLVQAMVDEGRIAPEEADAHPDRALLSRALGGGAVSPDIRLHDVLPGDRYLLCTDGLSAVVPRDEIESALASAPTPDDAADALVALATGHGAPDNVSCVVADAAPGGSA
ncbi:MerR family transcriptional regulator [Actinomadura yumaensis]|uniref:MerR family transcriptional regulator n=1 Tax=Actinomadura yumaensis TaxID=111807 RepID=A0ABW2CV85_9ACTN